MGLLNGNDTTVNYNGGVIMENATTIMIYVNRAHPVPAVLLVICVCLASAVTITIYTRLVQAVLIVIYVQPVPAVIFII